MKERTMYCQRCGKKTIQKSQRQKYCPDCSEIEKREKQKAYKQRIFNHSPAKTKKNQGLILASIKSKQLRMTYGEYMSVNGTKRAEESA